MEDALRSDGPCPCGSGRLFAACCEQRCHADVAAWQSARAVEVRVVPAIAAFALDTWGPTILEKAVTEFTHGPEITAHGNLHRLAPIFDAWFAFGWVPDRHEERVTVPIGWPRRTVATVWLCAASPGPDVDRKFAIAATEEDILFSPLLVESVVPGWTLTVRDMLTGRRFSVVDPEVSYTALPDDMLLSAILTLDDRRFLLGTASHAVPCDWRFELKEDRECHNDASWHRRRFWVGYEWESFNGYCKAYRQRLMHRDHLQTPIDQPVHLRWQVLASFADALERLRPLTRHYGDHEALDPENGPDGEPHVLMEWYDPGPSGKRGDWQLLGCLYLDEGRLAADVSTRALADRLIAEVTALAGDVTTLLETRPCGPRKIHDRRSALLTQDAIDSMGPATIH